MKTTTPAKKIAPQKKSTASSSKAPAGSITLPLQQVPTVWKRAAKDENYPTVEDWAAAMLNFVAAQGNLVLLPAMRYQYNRWQAAYRPSGQVHLDDWVKAILDAACQVVKKAPAEKCATPPTGAVAGSITLRPHSAIIGWERCAKERNYPSVEEWAVAMLDIISWQGNRFTIMKTDEHFSRWCRAARAHGQPLDEWIQERLDAASAAPVKGGLS
jgi:hypothetical protein